MLLLVLVLLLLSVGLLLRLPLLVLLRRWLRTLRLPSLVLFGLALFFVLLFLPCVRRVNHCEEQKQGGDTRNSNDLHK